MKNILILGMMILLFLGGCAETVIQADKTIDATPSGTIQSEEVQQEGGMANDYPLPPELPE